MSRNPNASSLPYRPHGVPIASYETYAQAQHGVDHLSDQGFPVENLSIVGTDLRLVEQVTGRLTRSRAVAAGGASGAWFGGFVGLLVGIFATDGAGEWLGVMLMGVLFGAIWGLLLALVGYNATGGRRDFISRSGIVAGSYQVLCKGQRIDEARELLARLAAAG